MSKRRPYVRPMDGWWKKHPFYIEYMIHEWTAFFVAAYAFTLLAGVICLALGESAWNCWLATMQSPLSIIFHVALLVGVGYHAFTWFKLVPLTMPPFVIGGKKLPPQLLVTGGWAAAIFCTIAFFGVFWGVTA